MEFDRFVYSIVSFELHIYDAPSLFQGKKKCCCCCKSKEPEDDSSLEIDIADQKDIKVDVRDRNGHTNLGYTQDHSENGTAFSDRL